MNTQFLLLISLLFVTLTVQAQRTRQCAEQELEYIRTYAVGAELSGFELPEKQIPTRNLKFSEVCEDRNEIVMDGLSFTLYMLESEKANFIDIYNGFDGTRMMYGPFKR